MRFLKEKKGIIISFIIGVIIASSITVYAYSYFASDISYTKPGTTQEISVEAALNDLYSKSNKTPQQVATFTTQNASYTFQNDGYIIGTASGDGSKVAELLLDNGKDMVISTTYSNSTFDVSIYITEGTTVTTRSDGGNYNLTLYEFK